MFEPRRYSPPLRATLARAALLLPLLIALALVGFGLVYWLQAQTERRVVFQDATTEVQALEKILRRGFADIEEDLRILASLDELRAYLRHPDPEHREHLAAIWRSFLTAGRRFSRLVLRDAKGQPLLAFAMSPTGVTLTHEGKNESPHFYQELLATLQPGQLYVSRFAPPAPELRVGIPIAVDGQAVALLLVDYSGTRMSRILREHFDIHHETLSGRILLVDNQGHYLQGPHPEPHWRFLQRDGGARFQDDFPLAWSRIVGQRRGQLDTRHGLFTFVHLGFPTDEASPYQRNWLLIHYARPDVLYQRLASIRQFMGLLGGFTLVVLIGIALSWARVQLQREHALASLRGREALLSQSQRIAHFGSWEWRLGNPTLEASSELRRIFHLPTDREPTYRAIARRVHPADRDVFRAATRQAMRQGGEVRVPDLRLRLDSGAVRWVHCEMAAETRQGKTSRIIGTAQDITTQKRNEESLRLAATAFESQEAILITDAQATILRVNRAFTEITGYRAEEAVGNNPRLLKSGRQPESFYREMWNHLHQHGFWQGEIWNRRKSGETYPEWLTIAGVKNDKGETTHFVSHFSDVSERKAAEEKIRYLAYYDELTRLPNRTLFLERLRENLLDCAQQQQFSALFHIDVDHFKTINESLGHASGDALLQAMAKRLRDRMTEPESLARISEDAFAVLLPLIGGERDVVAGKTQDAAEKLHFALGRPYRLQGQEVHATCSMGIVIFPTDGNDAAEDLLKKAETAMYRAKDAGRDSLRFFLPSMQTAALERLRLHTELRQALDTQQFELFYQAQTDVQGKLVGAEALLRWHHPERGLVSPAAFLAAAEETGLILKLGDWVLFKACERLSHWQTQGYLPDTWYLSVNISPSQFLAPGFEERVLALLDQFRIDPAQLKLEMTEGILIDRVEQAIRRMTKLHQHGIRFALDDFGTGYSSLSYLAKLPVQQLKIDRGFVQDMTRNPTAAAIVDTTIVIAWHMGLEIVAEGVESHEELIALQDKGCYVYQGYYFSRPLPEVAFTPVLQRGRVEVG